MVDSIYVDNAGRLLSCWIVRNCNWLLASAVHDGEYAVHAEDGFGSPKRLMTHIDVVGGDLIRF